MAKKPPPSPAKLPLSPASSSEEEGEDSSSHEEQTNDTKPVPQKALAEKQESESESESEESSDEEEEDEDEEQKPLPVDSTPSKPKPEPESKKIATPLKPIPGKPNLKSPFTRLWSFDDEIAILEAMVDYQSKHGTIKLSAAVVKDLHESVRKSLSIDADTAKLAKKIGSMRKKYTDAYNKGDKIKFPNPHSKTVHELSKKVWGKEVEVDHDDGFEVEGLNGDSVAMTVNRKSSLKREFPFIRDALGANRLALEKLDKVDEEKAVALEKKFKKLKFDEINLIRKAYKLVCNEAQKAMN